MARAVRLRNAVNSRRRRAVLLAVVLQERRADRLMPEGSTPGNWRRTGDRKRGPFFRDRLEAGSPNISSFAPKLPRVPSSSWIYGPGASAVFKHHGPGLRRLSAIPPARQ